ncbi:Uncharacterised protein [Shigella sonnei]|nr:Uncharacterised protein [Shigella sonnei]
MKILKSERHCAFLQCWCVVGFVITFCDFLNHQVLMSNVVFHAGEGIQAIGKSVDIVQQNIPDGGFRCQFNQPSFSPSSHRAGEMHAACGFTSTRQNEAVNWGDGVHCTIDRVFQRGNFFRTDVTLLR